MKFPDDPRMSDPLPLSRGRHGPAARGLRGAPPRPGAGGGGDLIDTAALNIRAHARAYAHARTRTHTHPHTHRDKHTGSPADEEHALAAVASDDDALPRRAHPPARAVHDGRQLRSGQVRRIYKFTLRVRGGNCAPDVPHVS
jgi:hypothetical protein